MSNSDDVISYNESMLSRYDAAMKMKAAGDIDGVERLLLPSVSPPSIYHGHYRELFINWRKKIRRLETNKKYAEAFLILKEMTRLDGELLKAMSDYWSPLHGLFRAPEYFIQYSKLTKTDVKKIGKYARVMNDEDLAVVAEKMLLRMDGGCKATNNYNEEDGRLSLNKSEIST